ncbi:hypothetical protein EGR52_09160 [bacterium]|nr:hypothetical protein [bacterium]
MENNSKNKIVIVVSCLLLVIAGSFAYFVARIGSGAQGDVKINANSMDDLKFEVNKDISLSIDQYNFASGAGNLSDEATAKAMLKANSTKNTATYNYYVYFNVTTNTYVYSTSDNKPEIVLTITDPNGAEVTSINGLNYVSATNADGTVVKGFDITTYKGLLEVANNHEITSNSSTNYTNQEWNFKVTFINLDTNQLANEDKSLKGEVLIQKNVIPTVVADVCSSGDNLAGCVKNLGDNGDSNNTNIYYHDSTLENGAGDNSYRYAGPSETTNNFVCFGYNSTDGSCPTDNLYRIIGVFGDEVKLIKYDYAKSTLLGTDGDYSGAYSSGGTNKGQNSQAEIGVYYWNHNIINNTINNTWSESRLNTINLNKNYINNIGTKWSGKISDHTWKVGGNTYDNITGQTAPNAYQNEINSQATDKTVNAKVGLMYVSDYGYAASSNYWSTILEYYDNANVKVNNWMYMGLIEWTLAPQTGTSYNAFYVDGDGYVTDTDVINYTFAVRPVLYLKSTISYGGGSGTAAKPILVN